MTDATKVRVGVTGEVYNAVVGTTLPTDPNSALNAAFLARPLGYLTEDGVTQSINEDVTEIKAWQNGDTVRKIRTSQDLTYQFAMMETSKLTLETYYGNVSGFGTDPSLGSAHITGAELPHYSWVFHIIDGNARVRLVIPDGQITERGDTTYVGGDALSYPVTVTAYPSLFGIKAIVYVDNDVTTSS